MLEASKNNCSSWKALWQMHTYMARTCWGHSWSCFIYAFTYQVISEKHCEAKMLLVIWETFLYENSWSYNSCKFSYKFVLKGHPLMTSTIYDHFFDPPPPPGPQPSKLRFPLPIVDSGHQNFSLIASPHPHHPRFLEIFSKYFWSRWKVSIKSLR